MKKKTLSITETDFSPYDLEGTLADLRNMIDKLIDKYGPTARFDYDADYYHDYDPNPSPQYTIITHREETDDEYNIRVAKEQAYIDAKEKLEREEFERLAKKFSK